MTARFDPAEWLWVSGLVMLSAMVGLLAGIEPALAIAVSIGCGFVLLVFVDLGLGLALFTMLAFLEVLGASSVVSVGKLGGILIALAWLALVMTRPDARSDFFAVHPGMVAVIGAFLGWTLLSTIWAESPNDAVATFIRYALNAVLFLIIFTAVRTRRTALFVAAAYVIGGMLAALYGLSTGSDYGSRLTGQGLDPNELASTLVAALALSVGVTANLKRYPLLRLAAIGAGAACLAGLFLTASRGGLLALGVMLVAGLIFSGRWRPQVAAAAALVALCAVYYFTALAPTEARDRINEATSGQERSQEGRTTLWEVGERMARDNLVTGVGAGNFPTASIHYLLEPGSVGRTDEVLAGQPAHNTYLEVLAENGIVGLTLFGMIIVFSLRCGVLAAREFMKRADVGGEVLARALVIGTIGLLTANIFLSEQAGKQMWLLLGLAPALLAVARHEEPERRRPA